MDLGFEDSVTAVLDGQQRFTALNIGLRGSHAEKLPYKRWTSDYAFPKKQLHLNLRSRAGDDELGLKYEFAFLEKEARHAHAEGVEVAAGHGLDYTNIAPVVRISEIVEYNIGHSMVSRAIFVGMEQAVKEMLRLLGYGSP